MSANRRGFLEALLAAPLAWFGASRAAPSDIAQQLKELRSIHGDALALGTTVVTTTGSSFTPLGTTWVYPADGRSLHDSLRYEPAQAQWRFYRRYGR